MLSSNELNELVRDRFLPDFTAEQARLTRIDRWYRWHNEPVKIPAKSTREHRDLVELAKVPILRLVVNEVAQGLFVEGFRTGTPSVEGEQSSPWRLWKQNDLEVRQGAIHKAAIAYGCAYATAVPGELNGQATAALRGVSPRKMMAFYTDPAEDDYPRYAFRSDGGGLFRVYDEEAVYTLRSVSNRAQLEVIKTERHDVGVCPVVRFAMLDLDGRSEGEIEPNISLAQSLDKTKYDRHLIQHFNSFKVRTVAGMEMPRKSAEDGDGDGVIDDAEVAAARLRLAHDTLLVSESVDTKFGSLPETSMDGMIRAFELDVKTLAAVTQTPVYSLVGDMVNVSAEGLAAARASADAKLAEYRRTFGRTHARWLRLGAEITGDEVAANDFEAAPKWADTAIRSLSSAADALGKLASMLGVPAEALWSMIPGVTEDDVTEWRGMRSSGDSFERLLNELERSAAQPMAV